MGFMNDMKTTALNSSANVSVTENGAVGFESTGKSLVDMNFAVSSMRGWSVEDIENSFTKAFYENKLLALKWLFYVADVRGGSGERRLFTICFKWLAKMDPELAKRLIKFIPEYNRWDSIFSVFGTECENDAINIIKSQLYQDLEDCDNGKPISLLAKWMPSINATSEDTKKLARCLAGKLKLKYKSYRQFLSKLRKYLKVVEVDMSNNEWDKIDYAKVPSRANVIYKNAFMKHDQERRTAYLESLVKGETKINGAVNFPHDIIHAYRISNGLDVTYEELWKALPDYVNSNGNTICVKDGSGSMRHNYIANTNLNCDEVATGLAIYFAEKCSGEFKDNFITFSAHPRFIDMSNCKSLREKISVCRAYNEYANTNIEAVFNLILKTAIRKQLKQEDIPTNILILSDMEFDDCTQSNGGHSVMRDYHCDGINLFDLIKKKYEEKGYKLPRLVFWNIYSRTNTIPVIENELGVALVSGFSPATVKMVLSNKANPYDCLVEQLNSIRYSPIEEAVKDLL